MFDPDAADELRVELIEACERAAGRFAAFWRETVQPMIDYIAARLRRALAPWRGVPVFEWEQGYHPTASERTSAIIAVAKAARALESDGAALVLPPGLKFRLERGEPMCICNQPLPRYHAARRLVDDIDRTVDELLMRIEKTHGVPVRLHQIALAPSVDPNQSPLWVAIIAEQVANVPDASADAGTK